jgi:hypothetical protein
MRLPLSDWDTLKNDVRFNQIYLGYTNALISEKSKAKHIGSFREFSVINEGRSLEDLDCKGLEFALSLLDKVPPDLIGEKDQWVLNSFKSVKMFVKKNKKELQSRLSLMKLKS